MGEEIVRSIIHLYEQIARYNPGDSTQDLLLKTYLARLKNRRVNIEDERVVLNAMTDIHLPAQLPEGKNIKALALYCLFKERPDIIETYPKFASEYERLMAPILENANFDNEDVDPPASNFETTSMKPTAEPVQPTSEDVIIQEAKIFQSKQVNQSKKKQQAKVDRNISALSGNSSPSLEEHNKRITRFVQSNTPENAKQSAAVAAKYADVKSSNNESRRLQKKIPSIPKTNPVAASPENSAEAKAAKFEWLKDNAKYFSRIKSQGRTLSEYQEGIIKKYEQWLANDPKLKDD